MTLRFLRAAFAGVLLAAAAPAPELAAQEIVHSRGTIRIAQDYTLPPGEAVREVRTIFGDATIEGDVRWDVVVVMGSARLAGTARIGGSLVVVGGSATIEEGASIGDDLVIVGGTLTSPATFTPRGEHVVIGTPWLGGVLEDVLPWMTQGLLLGRLIVPDLEWVWLVVATFFLLYLALNVVFDRPVAASADALIERPFSAFLVGFLVLLLIIPALAILAATVIGLALVPFVLCAVILIGLVGKVAVARTLGRGVLRTERPEGGFQAVAAFVIGFALLTLAYMVPILGFITWALTTLLGVGAAMMTFHGFVRRERQVPAPPSTVAPTPQPATASIATRDAGASTMAGEIDAASAPPIVADPPSTPPPPAGPPPTAFAAGLAQYPRASFFDRVAAFALDAILVAIANALLDLTRNDGAYFLLLLGYHVAFWAWKGTTLGGIVCSLRVIRTHGTELRFADALVRGLSSVFSIAALGIGCLWMLQDPERQMWHDKIAGTLVVKVPRDLVLP